LIPACAGNACTTLARLALGAVHPRVCGERAQTATLNSPYTGSSPRVRGTRVAGRRRVDARRFIPACAGNAWDANPWVAAIGGSSPRVRGTPAIWA